MSETRKDTPAMSRTIDAISGNTTQFATAMIGGQLFGLPISRVQDVFMPERLTRVPLAPDDVAGVLNLRGRIVTAIDMRAVSGCPRTRTASRRWRWASTCAANPMAC